MNGVDVSPIEKNRVIFKASPCRTEAHISSQDHMTRRVRLQVLQNLPFRKQPTKHQKSVLFGAKTIKDDWISLKQNSENFGQILFW